ncbi:hypothetical protein Gotri_010405 [Gossypium trilobum]|uniref:Uncharacterized protein n=1 Tax=Gossypium trilobum TaxID=34281 RepID=A0A7J9EQ94_9ROSI|nr:hypothetical protein [Gossypium trilobum]
MEWLENMAFISNVISLGYAALTAQAHFHRLRPPSCQALLSLGADQFDERDPKRSSFFNWFLLSFAVGAIIGVTFIVWISTNQGNGRWMHAR